MKTASRNADRIEEPAATAVAPHDRSGGAESAVCRRMEPSRKVFTPTGCAAAVKVTVSTA